MRNIQKISPLCRDCKHRKMAKVSKSKMGQVCVKYDKPVRMMAPMCPYNNVQVEIDTRIANCKKYNDNFIDRFNHLDNGLGFHI